MRLSEESSSMMTESRVAGSNCGTVLTAGESLNLKMLDIDSIVAVDLQFYKLDDLRLMKDFKTLKFKDAIYFG